ncbi:ABC transporter F family member 4-like [Penaeus vannamei]|uniref:ABC transporter F family member 4-like n=1 Tax=Penaeus vannamei TaxID=6689 RepID=UPI00387FA0B6
MMTAKKNSHRANRNKTEKKTEKSPQDQQLKTRGEIGRGKRGAKGLTARPTPSEPRRQEEMSEILGLQKRVEMRRTLRTAMRRTVRKSALRTLGKTGGRRWGGSAEGGDEENREDVYMEKAFRKSRKTQGRSGEDVHEETYEDVDEENREDGNEKLEDVDEENREDVEEEEALNTSPRTVRKSAKRNQ